MLKPSIVAVCCLAALSCRQSRELPAPTPVYEADIADLLQAHCNRCHSAQDAGAGFRTDSYLATLGCRDAGAALVEVLEREDHRHLLDSAQSARLRAWVEAGAPLHARTVHAPGILNPRSPDWHGKLATRDQLGPITRADHPDVCGRCHAGAPVTPKGIEHSAAGAPACTSCHNEPRGVLACGTCHGDGAGRPEPPRDACLFPDSRAGAHRVHLQSTRLAPHPLSCVTCHGELPTELGGKHGDGHVDVVFDAAVAGDDARYDESTGQCTVRCHNRGGARAQPAFQESGPLGCGDCHGQPPADHFAGKCDHCHHGVDADGGKLLDTQAHMDGTSGPGEGPGVCGSCHGHGDDPWPVSTSHALHRASMLTGAIACAECHPVPAQVLSPGHLDRGTETPPDFQFGALASARERSPMHTSGRCMDVACHGAGLPEQLDPPWIWDEPTRADRCSGCHGIPPVAQHTTNTNCSSLVCHGAEVSAGSDHPAITEPGRTLHINGRYDTTQR